MIFSPLVFLSSCSVSKMRLRVEVWRAGGPQGASSIHENTTYWSTQGESLGSGSLCQTVHHKRHKIHEVERLTPRAFVIFRFRWRFEFFCEAHRVNQTVPAASRIARCTMVESLIRFSLVPELPDIVVYIEALEKRILRRRLEHVRIASPFLLRTATPPVKDAEGKTVVRLRRLGKRICIGLDNDIWLVLHLMIAARLPWT